MKKTLYYDYKANKTSFILWRKDSVISDEHNSVYKFTDLSSGIIYAGKILNLNTHKPNKKRQIENEINIHKSIKHENILPYVKDFIDGDEHVLITNLCDCKNLSQMDINKDNIDSYLSQIARGMEYLNSNRILHGDLKPQNILIDYCGILRIADFGYSIRVKDPDTKDIEGETRAPVCGTPNYMAPELIKCVLNSETYYSPKNSLDILFIDNWAFGVIIYILATGERPFEKESFMETYNKIVNVEYEIPEGIPQHLSTYIKNLLVLEPQGRMPWSSIF